MVELEPEEFLPVNTLRWEDDVIYDPEEARSRLIEDYAKTDVLAKVGWIPTPSTRTLSEFITSWKSGDFLNMFKLAGEPLQPIVEVKEPIGYDEINSFFSMDELGYRWEDDVVYDSEEAQIRLVQEFSITDIFMKVDDIPPPSNLTIPKVIKPEKNEKKRSNVFKRPDSRASSGGGERLFKCGACGEFGHYKSSKKCPMFEKIQIKQEVEELSTDFHKSRKSGKKSLNAIQRRDSRASTRGGERQEVEELSTDFINSRKSERKSLNAIKRPDSRASIGGGERLFKCGACGELGHYKTNMKCPMFGKNKIKKEVKDLSIDEMAVMLEEELQ